MTPFHSFRSWVRRAPAGERAGAAIAGVAVVALLVWVAIPSSGSSTTSAYPGSGTATGTSTTGSGAGTATGTTGTTSGATTGATGTTGLSGFPGSAGSSASTSGTSGDGSGQGATGGVTSGTGTTSGTTGGGSQGCTSPPGSAGGLTGQTVKLVVLIGDIAGPAADEAFGVADPRTQRTAYEASIADLNKRGGLACRRVVADYKKVNSASQSSLRQACLEVVQGGYYAILDAGVYANSTLETCYGQAKIPYFTSYILPDSIRQKYYPYMFANGTYDRIYHDSIFALEARGAFNGPHFKLGLLYRSCFGDIVANVKTWLNQAGAGGFDTYDLGCPEALASPIDLQNAVRKFRIDGVTTVFGLQILADLGSFTRIAEQQGYRPKYALADDEIVTVTQSGSITKPNPRNFNGALAIAFARDGEENTKGMHPTEATKRCDKILTHAGLKASYDEGYSVGNACDAVWMLEAAVEHAPSVAQADLAAGLQAAGSVEFSFPQGPNFFGTRGETAAGQYYRPVQYYASCRCWRVISAGFTRSNYV